MRPESRGTGGQRAAIPREPSNGRETTEPYPLPEGDRNATPTSDPASRNNVRRETSPSDRTAAPPSARSSNGRPGSYGSCTLPRTLDGAAECARENSQRATATVAGNGDLRPRRGDGPTPRDHPGDGHADLLPRLGQPVTTRIEREHQRTPGPLHSSASTSRSPRTSPSTLPEISHASRTSSTADPASPSGAERQPTSSQR